MAKSNHNYYASVHLQTKYYHIMPKKWLPSPNLLPTLFMCINQFQALSMKWKSIHSWTTFKCICVCLILILLDWRYQYQSRITWIDSFDKIR